MGTARASAGLSKRAEGLLNIDPGRDGRRPASRVTTNKRELLSGEQRDFVLLVCYKRLGPFFLMK